jgi:hypothetical protein
MIALVSLLAGQTACTLQEPRVARGDGIVTGNAAFDDFFSAVRDVRSQVLAAPKDAETGHAELIKALGLDGKAKSSAAIEEAGVRAKKLQDKGVLLHLEIAPEPKVLAAKGRVEVGAEGEALFKAMETTLKTSIETRKRLAALAARAVDLEKRRAELRAKAEAAFKAVTPDKRAEIVAELDAAKGVLVDAGDGATRADGAESRFVVDLVYAVETGGGARPENAKQLSIRKGWTAHAKPAASGVPPAPAGAPSATPAALKKKPKGGDDFEP